MSVRILLLRHRGVELPLDRPFTDWVQGNILLWNRDRGMGDPTSVLELNEVTASPGRAILARLYAPVMEFFDGTAMRVRGIESVKLTPEGPAVGIVQAWRIDLNPQQTDEIRKGPPSGVTTPWYPPPFVHKQPPTG